jgi:hypothetical protein
VFIALIAGNAALARVLRCAIEDDIGIPVRAVASLSTGSSCRRNARHSNSVWRDRVHDIRQYPAEHGKLIP